MTSKSKNAVRVNETEIEKSREESNWKKAVELAQQMKAKSPEHESLAHFLIGEAKLEAHLDEWPPIKENIEKAQRELSDPKGYLTLATDDAGKKAGVALDAHLLLGKLHFACGSYDDALKHYKYAELNTLTEKELPVRSLRIVAESYAIKGLCLEQTVLPATTSRFKQAETEAEMIRSFELASDLTLLYLQRAANARAGATLETALQRAPLLHIRAGRLACAVDRYREMLTAVESVSTQALRLTLARQLAEVLMRGVTGQVYKAPKVTVPPQTQGTLSRRRDDYYSEGPWKPKKYGAINQFVPRNEYEEVVLVLVVGEAMAVRDAVLSQSGEFEAARQHSLRNAAALADLLALAAARWGQLPLVLECLERAMKFSFGCAHIWRQRALATAAAARADPAPSPAPPPHTAPAHGSSWWGAHVRAAGVARRALPLVPRDVPLRLVTAAAACRAGWIEEGIRVAEEALRIEREKPQPSALLARCYLYCAIAHQMQAQKTNSRIEKDSENDISLKYLVKSVQLDDNDHLAFYHLGLQYMQLGMLNEAMDAARACLSRSSESAGGLRLAAALWAAGAGGLGCGVGAGGAGGRGAGALRVARLARHHYPAAEWPLWTLAALQATWDGGEAALATGKELLRLVSGAEEEADPRYVDLDALSDSLHDDAASGTAVGGAGGGGGGSTWRAGRALSEGASSQSAARARCPRAERRARAWLLLADLCLRLGRTSAAAGCVSEAAALTPFSHLVLYTRGRVHGACGEWEEARLCFQNALAIHPTHVDTMLHLGGAYYELGWVRLAERVLRAAVALEPRRADALRRLALVLGALGEPAAAADAAAAALALHPHAPHPPHALHPLCPAL